MCRPHRLVMSCQPLQSNIAVIGGGPAGLMAAEVLAGGGARVTVYDGMAVARAQVPAGGARRAEPHAQRGPGAAARPLWRGGASAAAGDRGVSAGGAARLVRGAGAGDVRRLERAGVSQGDEDLAAAARVAAAPRCGRRRLQAAASLDRLGRRGRARVRDARRPGVDQGRRHRAGARRRQLAAARLVGRLGRCAERGRRRGSCRCSRPTAGSWCPGRRYSAAASPASR